MKEVLEKLNAKHLFSSFTLIPPSVLGTRRKMTMYKGIDTAQYYHIVFSLNQKSRFGVKQAHEMVDFEERLTHLMGHKFKYKHLLLSAPLCSKAQKVLQIDGWNLL